MYGLYVITDEELSNGLSHYEIAKLACEGGADAIQLRDKKMEKDEYTKVAMSIRRITSLHDVLFFVNDHFDVALAAEADGVHLGQGDVGSADITKLKEKMLVGISVGSVDEAVAAEKNGADYVGFGPIFSTRSKHDARAAVGTDELKRIRSSVMVPIVAIGGITKENAPDVITSGADGIAVISAVVSQDDVRKAAAELKNIISSAKLRA